MTLGDIIKGFKYWFPPFFAAVLYYVAAFVLVSIIFAVLGFITMLI